jgi:integrase
VPTNIIKFPGAPITVCSAPAPAPTPKPVAIAARADKTHKKSSAERGLDGRRRKDAKSRSVEPNIQEIPGENGGHSFRVQIRKSVDGKTYSFTKTFANLAMARKWKKKRLAEIEIIGVQALSCAGDTVADAIKARLAKQTNLGRSAKQQLDWLAASAFGKKKLTEITVDAVLGLADEMLADERLPQTVAGYLSLLVSTLNWASRRSFSVPVETLRTAMKLMWEDEVLARSDERKRRPSTDELNRILGAVAANSRQRIPLGKIIVFAIFTCRRLGEICRLRWEDLREAQKTILVRNMKHPRKKKGNDVWCLLTEEALAIIRSMPRVSEFIFPFKPQSVGTAWQRHRDRAEIVDLRFHDLRHEGITRLFEMGLPAAFVAKYSGHKNGGCLFRYEHVEEKGDKFADWEWTSRVIGDTKIVC